MKTIAVKDPGPHYQLVLDEEPLPSPGAGSVLIKVAAAGLNNADLLQARGKYPPPPGAAPILGMEVSGTVAALGEGVQDFAVGDRVCALLPGGGYAEYAVADAGSVLPVPTGIDLVEAAGLPEAAFTAWTNIVDAGRLAAGETLLVHGGTSGIGSLAIQIFAARGHTVFATAGSDAKCEACRTFGAARAINYRQQDFVAAVKDATGGKGVDVILDMVGGDYIQRNLEAAAVWGRIVNIAYQSGVTAEVNFAPMLAKRLTLAATTLRGRTPAQKRAIRDALLAQVWPGLGTRVRPAIERVFALEKAQKAHESMAAGGHVGKILLSLGVPQG
ncbi:MAG: NAD(P)H-quinone oxidoreductase [Alphaproteobacteria bacterium]|jgi:NADPH2:quinone reductase|nr:NAD(P)H-quinone oxidoreductase [Alphaproteobacteria bacterium]MDB5739630.1 NAD(P)H-quinone oxidoreductase [Alphaproteobacteria bacterium]